MIKDTEIVIVSAVTKALELLDKDPTISPEKIIQQVMSSVIAKSDAKIYAISSVNNAIKIKRNNLRFSNRQIVQGAVSDYKKSVMKS